MKKYYPIIILSVIALIAIFVRVSHNSGVIEVSEKICAERGASYSPEAKACITPIATSTGSVKSPASASGSSKPVVTPRPTPSYTRGGTTVDPVTQFASTPDASLRVSLPAKNASITSPVRVVGEAKGTWYFEGTFPILITDANNIVIAETIAKAGGNWMTEKLVPFEVSVTFPKQIAGSRGHIILKKDNPSGLAQNDMSLDIPVTFK